ncbi:MAG: hypothetical protein ACOX9C_04305 [Kiritimatiellia bacterium]|jgi:hypothetical protein
MKISFSALALQTIREMLKADRANVYVLERDVPFVVDARLPRYDGPRLAFDPDALAASGRTAGTLKAFGRRDSAGRVVCDGATLAPDWPRGVRPASGVHDAFYLEIEAVAEAWKNEPFDPGPNFRRDWIARIGSRGSGNWTKADVRQLADALLGGTIKAAGGRRWIQRLYYTAVRLWGGVAHRAAPLAVAAASLWIAGCSGGCMAPPDIVEWPDGPPELERVEGGDLGESLREIAKEASRNP